ncbi:flagellar brake protein [Paenibacillus sp. 481]|uniref:flagellar brake protein n=1 Tax=Paenibacillus sp. 481 TaxID=2835869 RepID=UPI001E537C2C|nr:PilZ domain-containing protein [Paenibacillus sp. 481]UHA72942.1 PilZ domain-containing protein [Paenibacillus sp. 481]
MLPNVSDTIMIQSTRSQNGNPEYKARVADIDETSLWIEIPINETTGKYGFFISGEELDVYYTQIEGVKWHFSTAVIGAKQDQGVRLMGLRKPEPHWMTKMQRRSYLRVQAKLEMALRTEDGVKFLAFTEDVSGGGVSFMMDIKQELTELQKIQCWLVAPFKSGAIEHIFFVGEIIRLQSVNEEQQLVMMKFDRIADVEQQRLIRYCFERQLDLRK